MKQYNLCFLGFGNVGRALVRLLAAKSNELRELYGMEYRITGVASRRIGWLASPELETSDWDISGLLTGSPASEGSSVASNINEWLQSAEPDVVFETTSLNPETGQPAIDYLRAVLQFGAHAISANKGALVHGFDELRELANEQGKRFYFESAVLDSAPARRRVKRNC